MLTLPAAGLTAAAVYLVTDVLGDGAVGPLAVTAILAIACFGLWRANKASQVEPDEVITRPEGEPALEPLHA